jgi:hypothetical protein
MAFHDEEKPRKSFYQPKMFNVGEEVRAGIVRDSKEFVEGWVEGQVFNPTTKKFQTKWFDAHRKFTGFINGLEWSRFRDEGSGVTFQSVNLDLQDAEGNGIILKLPFNQKPYKVFAQCGRNIDFTQEVTFSAFKEHDSKKNKDFLAFTIEQGGRWIPWYYKNGVNGLPDGEPNEMTGKVNYDKRDEFLMVEILDYIKTAIESAAFNRGIAPAAAYDPDAMPGEGEDEPTALAAMPEDQERALLLDKIWGVFQEQGLTADDWYKWTGRTKAETQSLTWLTDALAIRPWVQAPPTPQRPTAPPQRSAAAASPRTNKTSVPSELDASLIPF